MRRAAILLMVLLANASAFAATEPPAKPLFLSAQFACSTHETWNFTSNGKDPWLSRFLNGAGEKEVGSQDVLLSFWKRQSAKSPVAQFLAEYWFYRNIYFLNMVHLAEQGFNSLLARPNVLATTGIKVAAIECLNQIHRRYSTLSLDDAALEGLKTLSVNTLNDEQKEALWEAVTAAVSQKIARSQNLGNFASELQLLSGSGQYDAYAHFLMASKMGMERETVMYGAYLLRRIDALKPLFKTEEDLIHLNVARAYYGLGRYDQAIEEFKKVKPTSNYLAQAVTGLSWSYLMKGEYAQATSSAYNLLVGGLRNTFGPEGHEVVSIAFNETCHYPEFIQSVELFKRSNDKAYRWLHNWKAQNPWGSQPKMYDLVADYLKKKTDIPDKVGTEWLRSPLFLAMQTELNLFFDEKNSLKSLWHNVKEQTNSAKGQRWLPIRNELSKSFVAFLKSYDTAEAKLITEINADLATRTYAMLDQMVASAENIQRVQVEVYNSMGERIMAEGIAGEKEQMKNLKKTSESMSAFWDWGRYPAAAASGDGTAEVWEDELGFLKTDIKDICPKNMPGA